jgi:hypothetical protein
MSAPGSPWPPRLAAWLLDLFVPSDNAESIIGDLFEEFSSIAASADSTVARRWFWRQTLRTVLLQLSVNFRLAPVSLMGSVLAGFALLRFGGGLSGKLIFAILHCFRIYPNHWNLYVFWATDGLLIGRVFESILVGCLVALISKHRELVATSALGLVQFLFTEILLIASLVWNGTDFPFAFQLFLSLLCNAIAIVVGGYIVREIRLARSRRFKAA